MRGNFGIPEPAGPIKTTPLPDIALVPGVAFDISGSRIGYGKGYYDRFLSAHALRNCFRLGVCFESQIVKKISPSRGDVRMNAVITERRLLVV